jgi:autotransporter-associated beta strand protein
LDLQGTATLDTPAILLAGANDFRIRNTAGGSAGLAPASALHVYVQAANLAVAVPITGSGAVVKSGQGTLSLEGVNTFSGPLTINEGVVRAVPGVGLGGGVLELRGGVLEIAGGGTFNRHLDSGVSSGSGRISWSAVIGLPVPSWSKEDRGSGGFAAVGANCVVDLNGLGTSDIVWEDPGFLGTGYALVLGSRNADARVELVDNFGLGLSPTAYNAREIRAIDNPGSTADVARISGVIFSDTAANNGTLHDLLKTGDGTLELSGANTYIGGTIVAEGTLLLGHAGALGNPAPGAYVLVGNRDGTADAGLLTSAPLTISREIAVPAGSSGKSTLGTAAAGSSAFMGNISVGASGETAAKILNLYAAPLGTVTFSGTIAAAGGYTGHLTLTKSGTGTVVLDAVNSHTGDTHIQAGTLELSASGQIVNSAIVNDAAFRILAGSHAVHGIAGTGATEVLSGSLTADAIVQGTLVIGSGAQVVIREQIATSSVQAADAGTAAVPEPGSGVLAALGLVVLLVVVRRRSL